LKAGTSVQNFTIIKSPRKIDTNTDWDYIEPRFDAIIGTVACQLCHFRDLSMLGKKKLHRKCHPEVSRLNGSAHFIEHILDMTNVLTSEIGEKGC